MTECKERVISGLGWGRYRNCKHKAVKDGYCKMHHPDKKRERDAARERKMESEQNAYALQELRVSIGWLVINELGLPRDPKIASARALLARYVVRKSR